MNATCPAGISPPQRVSDLGRLLDSEITAPLDSTPAGVVHPPAWRLPLCMAPPSAWRLPLYKAPSSLALTCSLCKTPSGLYGHPRGYPSSTRRPPIRRAHPPAGHTRLAMREAPTSSDTRGSPCVSSTRRTTTSKAWRSERNAAFDLGSLIRATDSYAKTDEALPASRSAKHGRRRAPRVALGLTKDQDTHTDSALPAFRSTTRKHRLLLPTVAQSASFISERSLSNDTTDYDETPENGHPGRSESPLQRTARSDS